MKLVILDRDGVINKDSDAYIKSPEKFIPLEGSLEAIARLKKAGYTVAIATNQSGIARGYYDVSTLDAMHAKLGRLLEAMGARVDLIVYCPHGPGDGCECRKPKPGLLNDIAGTLKVSLKDVPFVGDSLGDLEAARAVGARPVLVLTGKGNQTKAKMTDFSDSDIYEDLAAFVESLTE